MLSIPVDVLKSFDGGLKKRKVPLDLYADYRKWLRYYLDFRAKYSLPAARSEHVRLFIEKLRSKNQPQNKLEQAAQALSQFFASQPQKKPTDTSGVLTAELPHSVVPSRQTSVD